MIRNYRNSFSDFKDKSYINHCDKYVVLPENMTNKDTEGNDKPITHLCIDETCLYDGEVYTIVSTSEKKCAKGSLIALVKGTKSEVVINHIKKIRAKLRYNIKTITMDLSDTMSLIAKHCFPYAEQIVDRFHVQKLINTVVQDIRVKYRWEAQGKEDKEVEKAQRTGVKYDKVIFPNNETISQLFTRGRYALYTSKEKWSERTAERIKILFDHFPEIECAYNISEKFKYTMNLTRDEKYINSAYRRFLTNKSNNPCEEIRNCEPISKAEFRMLHCKNTLIEWYDYIEKNDIDGYFKSVLRTFNRKYEEILRYCCEWRSNTYAESLNAKIKAFRARVKGVKDPKFFIFRLLNCNCLYDDVLLRIRNFRNFVENYKTINYVIQLRFDRKISYVRL